MLRRIPSFTRWTLTALLALVLALEIASVWWTFCWQRGYWCDANHVCITVERGKCELFWRREAVSPFNGEPLFIISPGFSMRRADDPGWGFRFGEYPPFTWTACEFTPARYGWSWGTISFPLTYPILALALPTAWLWLTALRRRNKARTGCCRKCGYDLHGLEGVNKVEEGQQIRCPECGEAALAA